MITPTLLDIAHIAGLPSNGDAISWNDEFNIGDSIGIDCSEISYTNFIQKNKGADGTPVSDVEHTTFLLCWLNVVDLWLKSIFRPRIPLAVDALPKKAINGIQLTCLQKPSSRYSLESFRLYLSWFFDLKNDVDDETFDLFPFISLPLPAAPCFDSLDYPLDQQAGDEMWAYSLVPQKLRVGAPGDGTLENRYKLNLYSPQFVARQFGFAQALPFPAYFNPAEPLVKYEISNTTEFDDAISLTEERLRRYRRVPGLTRCCYSTQSFDDWWSSYFISHCPSLEQALINLNLASIVQSAPALMRVHHSWF
ncbi:hypothetical protein PIB30_092449 [Stylosanthes scabra]|uniref:Aminotransferase-like plant mobile domain-containing protein n=1 Tax=Stylosanthes scabra TaxID=79078 RepID=A0ABU6RUT5_9FABA|nr:hypothetical protein [Stylosanthes scabra]